MYEKRGEQGLSNDGREAGQKDSSSERSRAASRAVARRDGECVPAPGYRVRLKVKKAPPSSWEMIAPPAKLAKSSVPLPGMM